MHLVGFTIEIYYEARSYRRQKLCFVFEIIDINNQQDATVKYNLLFQCFLIAQHVSSDTPLIIRSSKTVIAASGFTYFVVAGSCHG